ncbi:MAG: 3-isopropylmalate dehydratase [Deltaproteobacteria bacterium]|nr:3-isopropylmalate dehydratase [Deltaproteobacteria bacterium]
MKKDGIHSPSLKRRLQGTAWVFGDNVDADWDICNLHDLRERAEEGVLPAEEELAKRCLAGLNPEFPCGVRKGDFIVAGTNTGCSAACLDGLPGDPHLHALAPVALKSAGIAAVLCESASVNFQRNSIDLGLPVMECKGITKMVQAGHLLEVNLETGTVRNLDNGAELHFTPFPEFMLEILNAGGIHALMAEKTSR